jgi:5'(3')-deoxyribonucleotidase/uncharacterized protein with PQ loop repeat
MPFQHWVGSLAAACTTLSFIPQIVKIRKQGGADLSFYMLFIFFSGTVLWLIYGLLLHAPEMIWANAVSTVLVAAAIALKVTHPNRRAALAAQGLETTTSAGVPRKAAGRPEPVPTRKLRVAVDMDEVIADAFGKMLRAYNERTGRDITREQIAREGIEIMLAPEFLTPELKIELDQLPHDRSFFGDLELMEGAQDALRDLSQDFEIFIASAAMDVPSSFDAKYQWLKQYFPFIPQSHYIFCGDKSILNADFLVDDRPRHFANFRGTGILFTAPHNVNRPAKLRADNWSDVVRILKTAGTSAE